MKPFYIRIDEEVLGKMDELCRGLRLSRNAYVRDLIVSDLIRRGIITLDISQLPVKPTLRATGRVIPAAEVKNQDGSA